MYLIYFIKGRVQKVQCPVYFINFTNSRNIIAACCENRENEFCNFATEIVFSVQKILSSF